MEPSARVPIFPSRAQRVAPCGGSGSIFEFAFALAQARQALGGGRSVRIQRAFLLLAASLIALSPLHANAQEAGESVSVRDRPRPDYDPLGMRLGGFTLHAALGASATSTDNLFADASGNERDDIVYALSPSAQLASNWSRHSLGFELGANFSNHADFSSEDADTGYAAGYGRLDVGSNSSVSGHARHAQETESRTNPDALTTGAPVEYTRDDLGLSIDHRFNRIRVRGGLAWADTDYDDAGLIDQDFRDNEETSVLGRVQAELTPRIGAIFQVTADERDYKNAPGLSSDGRTYLAGVAVDFTDLVSGELTLGQFSRDYDSGASVDGTAVAGSLEWYVTRLTTLNFSAARGVREAGATAASPYVESEFGARVDHELQRNVILTASVQKGRRNYELIDRDDDYTAYQLGADYLLNRRIVLRARYDRDETDSSGLNAYRDFEVNAFTLGVSLRL